MGIRDKGRKNTAKALEYRANEDETPGTLISSGFRRCLVAFLGVGIFHIFKFAV